MFFVQASREAAATLLKIIQRYGDASGQAINVDKSSITFSKRTPQPLKAIVKNVMNIQKEGGVGKYLGLPEHFGKKKRDLFSSIVDRIKQKVGSWTTRYLSAAGKMVLLQSVLSPIPSHAMTGFQLPVSLCKEIQSAITRFWWDDSSGKKKMAWIAWTELTKPKALGGLGFRDFQRYNEAALAKLSWRIFENPDSLLSRMLKGKYFPETDILSVEAVTAISHGWRSVLVGRDLLVQNLGWVVGNGQSINVWYDPWLDHSKQKRPYGPASEAFVNLTVADLRTNRQGEWDVEKIRLFLPQYEKDILTIKPSIKNAQDKQVWLGTKSGAYSTKSGYYFASSGGGRRGHKTECELPLVQECLKPESCSEGKDVRLESPEESSTSRSTLSRAPH